MNGQVCASTAMTDPIYFRREPLDQGYLQAAAVRDSIASNERRTAASGGYDDNTAAEGKELTQVGPGTVMGELMRQYWIPAAQSSELERDGAPVRLMLLGEKLIAFRDNRGPGRRDGSSLPATAALAVPRRNEEGGIRCIYHGWKFDVSGNCIDMASVPPHQDFRNKVKARGLPGRRACRDRLGLYGILRQGAAAAGI